LVHPGKIDSPTPRRCKSRPVCLRRPRALEELPLPSKSVEVAGFSSPLMTHGWPGGVLERGILGASGSQGARVPEVAPAPLARGSVNRCSNVRIKVEGVFLLANPRSFPFPARRVIGNSEPWRIRSLRARSPLETFSGVFLRNLRFLEEEGFVFGFPVV